MYFKLNHGKGSFTVDVTSGHQLFIDDQHRFDSKVVLTCNSPQELPVGYGSSNNKSSSNMIGSLANVVSGSTTTNTTQRLQTNTMKHRDHEEGTSFSIHQNYSPLPSEVSADDAIFQHVKQVSSSEAAKIQSLQDREKNELEKAKTLSLIVEEENKTSTQDFCSEQLEEALQLSQMEQNNYVMEENELLEKALLLSSEQSQQHTNWSHEDEDEMMKKVLALSSEHAQIHCTQSQEEEEEMKKAIELSLQQT